MSISFSKISANVFIPTFAGHMRIFKGIMSISNDDSCNILDSSESANDKKKGC